MFKFCHLSSQSVSFKGKFNTLNFVLMLNKLNTALSILYDIYHKYSTSCLLTRIFSIKILITLYIKNIICNIKSFLCIKLHRNFNFKM